MKIHLCNPNTSPSMTETAAAVARSVAAEGTSIVATQPEDGPVSIEGYYDEVFSIPGLIGRIHEHKECDAHVISCFDDTGLDAARCITASPVIGLCEAACTAAMMLGNRFTVVTTLSRSIPAIEKLITHYGFERRCASVRASEIPVLGLEGADEETLGKLNTEIEDALHRDRAEVIVLGCAGMADTARSLSERFGVPVVDGVSAAVKAAEGLVAMQLSTSKVLGYQYPVAKEYRGKFKSFEPG